MSVAQIGVFYIRVDSPLEHLMVRAGGSGSALSCSGEVYVEESWDMTQIEQATVPQVDWLAEDVLTREHLLGDKIPCSPKLPEFIEARDRARGVDLGIQRERHDGWRQKIDSCQKGMS